MPYDNAYDSFFNDRAMGQVPMKGYYLEGSRYQFEWPMRNYDMNRLVGQQAPGRIGGNNYGRDPGPSYTTGWSRPAYGTPAADAAPPTTVYAGDVANDVAQTGAAPASVDSDVKQKAMDMLPKLKMQHVVVIAAIAAIVTIIIVK